MTERDVRERDILVAANEFAYVQDLTKGDIVLYVGPTKISLSNTERIVDYRDGRFVPVRGDDGGGVYPFIRASASEYVILENPPRDPTARATKGPTSAVELLTGRRVVVPGPATFPLWPGQRAAVVAGHALKEDEYLVVRVVEPVEGEARAIGTELIVRGTDTSFYVPKTGLEVVPSASSATYVRKAHRLRRGTGLHLRVLKAFDASASRGPLPSRAYAAGEELFLEGGEGFFFPTDELEVLAQVTAIPLAEGEGLHVRDLETGQVRTVIGPASYLPDPTKSEVVFRALDDELARLYRVGERDGARAITVYVPSGFAILVVSAERREVVRGPATRVLAYDENLEVLELSTGRPKSLKATLRTCFLQVDGNKVSDLVRLRTKDHVEIEAAVSYRVSFTTEGPSPERWFHVVDYVGLLCDHVGSLMRAAARSSTLERFHGQSTELLRGAVLGEKTASEPRPGRLFDENGMWVYDVELLEVHILDAEVKDLLENAQRSTIVSELARQRDTQRLENERIAEEVNRGVLVAKRATLDAAREHEGAERALLLAKAESETAVGRLKRLGSATAEAEALTIRTEAEAAAATRTAAVEERRMKTQVDAFREQMSALAPELIATLKTLGHQKLAEELTRHAAPLAILGGESVVEVVERLLGSLPLGASSSVKAALKSGDARRGA